MNDTRKLMPPFIMPAESGVGINLARLRQRHLEELCERAVADDGRIHGYMGGDLAIRAGQLAGRVCVFGDPSQPLWRTLVLCEPAELEIAQVHVGRHGGIVGLLDGDHTRWGAWRPGQRPQDATIDPPGAFAEQLAALIGPHVLRDDMLISVGADLHARLLSTYQTAPNGSGTQPIDCGFARVLGHPNNEPDAVELVIDEYTEDTQVRSRVRHYLAGDLNPSQQQLYNGLRASGMAIDQAHSTAQLLDA